jgi:hypothetical protein
MTRQFLFFSPTSLLPLQNGWIFILFPLTSLSFEMGEQFYAFLPTPCPLEWVDNNLFYLLSTYLSFRMGEKFFGLSSKHFLYEHRQTIFPTSNLLSFGVGE